MPLSFSFRSGLSTVAPYRQGTTAKADAETGLPAIKLSSNESPFPPITQVADVVRMHADAFTRYPDASGARLVTRIAQHHLVDDDHVSLGAGSVEVISQLIHAMTDPGDEVIFPWRSFEAYPSLVIAAGARAVPVSLTAQGAHDLGAMLAAITDRTRVILICSPNNPTGATVSRQELSEFLELAPKDVVVAIDEAYTEFVRGPEAIDAVGLLREHPNIVVLRTFSKAFGLAGLRVGYGLGSPVIIEQMRKVALPFGVSAMAQDAAQRSLQEPVISTVLERVADTVSERVRLETQLQSLGVPHLPSQANFLWLPTGDDTERIAAMFMSRAIAVRAFPGEGIRVTIGTPADNDRVLAVLVEAF
jgi:histidinol-phosphate aminotransferase